MKPPLELFSLERKGCPVAGWPFRFEGKFLVLGEDRGRRRRPGLAIERWEFWNSYSEPMRAVFRIIHGAEWYGTC